MHDARAAFQPLIHCTPPTDPAFLACVSRAYGESAEILSSDAAILIGTLVRIRRGYPMASIIPLGWDRRGGLSAVWLVSREGWAELEVVDSAAEARRGGGLAVAESKPSEA